MASLPWRRGRAVHTTGGWCPGNRQHRGGYDSNTARPPHSRLVQLVSENDTRRRQRPLCNEFLPDSTCAPFCDRAGLSCADQLVSLWTRRDVVKSTSGYRGQPPVPFILRAMLCVEPPCMAAVPVAQPTSSRGTHGHTKANTLSLSSLSLSLSPPSLCSVFCVMFCALRSIHDSIL